VLAAQDGTLDIRQKLGLPVRTETMQVFAQMFAAASWCQQRSPPVPPSRIRRSTSTIRMTDTSCCRALRIPFARYQAGIEIRVNCNLISL